MSITIFTDLLKLIAWTFTHFTPIFYVFCMAIICSCVNIIRYVCGGRRL